MHTTDSFTMFQWYVPHLLREVIKALPHVWAVLPSVFLQGSSLQKIHFHVLRLRALGTLIPLSRVEGQLIVAH